MPAKLQGRILVVILLLLSVCITTGWTQMSPPPGLDDSPAIQSPETASFGKFGDIPVSFFNGAVEISVPLTELNVGKLKVPVSLAYDASGCRPDVHPGWVGLNWALMVGGVITRHVNCRPDEDGMGRGIDNLGFLKNYATLARSDWATVDYMEQSINPSEDLSPDEFSFNVNGISGVFMMDHTGKWIARSKNDPNIRVEHEAVAHYQLQHLKGKENIPLQQLLTKFTLTMSDGTKYIFGREQTAIEFSLPVLPTYSEPYNAAGPGIEGAIFYTIPSIYDYISASAWKLSEIITVDGNSVKFSYSHVLGFQQSTYSNISFTKYDWSRLYRSYDINQNNKSLLYTSLLDKIECSNGVSCVFTRSPSNELPWVVKTKPASLDLIMFDYQNGDWTYYKLDALEVKVAGILKNKISFGYIENNSERLKLNRVRFNTLRSEEGNNEYAFEYNPQKLPVYNRGQEDHWGYYNGKNFFGDVSTQFETDVPDLASYYASKEPDADLMDAEILTQVRYPTGGVTNFSYEPHEYSSLVSLKPSISLSTLPQNGIAGGVRIQKMETFDGHGGKAIVREFFYKKNYAGGSLLSSGILAARPTYYETISNNRVSFEQFSSSPLNYLNTTNGSHVTYSEVTEKSNDGYVIYKYTNHDNGYLDKPAFAFLSEDVMARYRSKLFAKLALERGQLLSLEYYNADMSLLRKEQNYYNDDPNRYNQYVRACVTVGGSFRTNFFTLPLYTFSPYLERRVVTDYFKNESNVSVDEFYEYDPRYNVVNSKTVNNSDGSVGKTSYKYVFDFSFSANSNEPGVRTIMNLRDKNVIAKPIEITQRKIVDGEELVLTSFCYLYKGFNVERLMQADFSKPFPSASFKGLYVSDDRLNVDPSYYEKIFFSEYDDVGNITEIQQRSGVPISYLWGYGRSKLIAKIENARYSQVESALGTELINNLGEYMPETYVQSCMNVLRAKLPEANVYGYASNVAGVVSVTDLNNIKTAYRYDQLNRLQTISDNDGNVTEAYEYGNYTERSLLVNATALDFGLVSPGQNAVQYVKVTNTGNYQISVTGVSGASQFAIVSPVAIPSGQTRDIGILFSPAAGGTYNSMLTFQSNAENTNSFSAIGVSNSTRIMSLSHTSIDFGSARHGIPRTAAVTITNFGTDALQITGISLPNAYVVDWTTASIGPNQSKVLRITLQAGIGRFAGTITISSNKTSGGNTIAVTGVGTPI